MCSFKISSRGFYLHSIINIAAAAFIILLNASYFPAYADEGRYPENLVWRLITEKELEKITGCGQTFYEREHSAPPLFEEPKIPLEDIQIKKNSGIILKPAPSSWELPPFSSIGTPENSQTYKSAKLQKSSGRKKDQAQTPASFTEISTKEDVLPDASLQPLPTRADQNFTAPDTSLPKPFSLRRYHTKDKGFFQIAAYAGQGDSLFAEKYFNTLKSAAPNRFPIEGFGQKAFLSLIPPIQTQEENLRQHKVADIATAEGSLSFSDIEPSGEAKFEELDPGLIKSSQAPSFKSIPLGTKLPADFENYVRKQLVKSKYKNIEVSRKFTAEAKEISDNPPSENENDSDQDFEEYEAAEEQTGLFDEEDKKELNPFAARTNLQEDPEGIYVMIIYYPKQSLVCEIAADSRCTSLQSFFNTALLIQARMQRW